MKTFAFILAGALLAAADEVTLKTGGTLSGDVEVRGDKVIIRTLYGQVILPRGRVAKIDRTKSSTYQDYREKLANADLTKRSDVVALLEWADARKLGVQVKELRSRLARLRWEALDKDDVGSLEVYARWARDNGVADRAKEANLRSFALQRQFVANDSAPALYALGLWARSHGLAADALVLFQEAITVDPDHEFARRALGYRRYKGDWLTETEVNRSMGLIEFEGDWMTPGTKQAILEARTLVKERKLLEQTRKELEKERRRFQAEQASARAEFERQRRELDARARDLDRRITDLNQRRPTDFVIIRCSAKACRISHAHVHCTRSGCRLTAPHTHCSHSGCRRTDAHRH